MRGPNGIVLKNATVRATVSLEGGWLDTLTIRGAEVLYPKQTVLYENGIQKIRGGCHVCAPNFGPGGKSRLPQHGFARESLWSIMSIDSTTVVLGMLDLPGGYRLVEFELVYELTRSGISITLKAHNKSSEPVRIEPGFHPYFSTRRSSVLVDMECLELEKLRDPLFMNKAPTTITFGGISYKVGAKNLPLWVLWTDRSQEYVCLEPTFNGFSFLQEDGTNDHLLMPGKKEEWSFAIEHKKELN